MKREVRDINDWYGGAGFTLNDLMIVLATLPFSNSDAAQATQICGDIAPNRESVLASQTDYEIYVSLEMIQIRL